MSSKELNNLLWFTDASAQEKGQPGIYHSFMASLATALNYMSGGFDPIWLMGTSAFAFRIWVNEIMYPSAMSIFNWSEILTEAVRQAGYNCTYISRMWDETAVEEERREQAKQKIINAIDQGIPAVLWDIANCEWGLITGYDTGRKVYNTMTCNGTSSHLPFEKLGRNGIDILSVAIPDGPNGRKREEIILNSLKAAVDHAMQREWNDRPKYQNGLEAFDMWYLIFQRWSVIVEAGKAGNIGADIDSFAKYYAGHYLSARYYARDYLRAISDTSEYLQQASESYKKVAAGLRPLWEYFSSGEKEHEPNTLLSFADNIRMAKDDEVEGIKYIRKFIDSHFE